MAAERTEEDAVRGVLPLTIGGQPVRLRVLTFDETDAWLGSAAGHVAGLRIDETDDPQELLGASMRAGSEAALASLIAYDVDGTLGADIRKRISPVELREALEVVAQAALPFDVESARLVAAAFGGPTRLTAMMLGMAMTPLGRSLVPSTPSPSPTGARDTTRSTGHGRRSSSSSAGSTGTSSSATRRATNGTPSPTA